MLSDPVAPSFLAQRAALRGPRQTAKALDPLPEVLLLLPCGAVAGADGFVALALWGSEPLAVWRRFLPGARGVPSPDTLRALHWMLDVVFHDGPARLRTGQSPPTWPWPSAWP